MDAEYQQIRLRPRQDKGIGITEAQSADDQFDNHNKSSCLGILTALLTEKEAAEPPPRLELQSVFSSQTEVL